SASSSSASSASSSVSSSASSSSASSASSSSAATSSSSGGPLNPNLIDNMEDGDASILMQGGRVGVWYTFNDMTVGGVQVPPAGANFIPDLIPGGGQNGSTRAAHTTGSGFTTWGAGMGFDLNNNGMTKLPYNAGAFTGISFWGKGAQAIRFQ